MATFKVEKNEDGANVYVTADVVRWETLTEKQKAAQIKRERAKK